MIYIILYFLGVIASFLVISYHNKVTIHSDLKLPLSLTILVSIGYSWVTLIFFGICYLIDKNRRFFNV